MLKNKKNRWIALAIVSLILIAGGLFYYLKNFKTEEKVTVIRIGSTAPGHLKFILNQQKGWFNEEFKKDGIKIEYFPFNGGQEAMTALATGSLDIAYTGADPALRTAASGADVVLIGISSFNKSSGGADIAVKKDSPIKSVKDLKGKKVAFLTGTVRHATLAKALKSEGLSLTDVEGLNLAFEAAGPALLRGDIDAIVESSTTFTPLLETNGIRIVLDGASHPEWLVPSAISANSSFVKKHPSLVKRLLKVDLKTSQWADANYEEAIKAFSEGTKKKIEAVRKDYKDGKFDQDPKITEDALNAFKAEEDFLKEASLSNGSIDYKKWVNSSFIDEVYSE